MHHRNHRIPGRPDPIPRPPAETPREPLLPTPDRAYAEIPSFTERPHQETNTPTEGRGESQGTTLATMEAMTPVLQAVTTAIVDAIGHTELRPVPLPPKASAPMYRYHEAILAVSAGALELPLLTDRGWLLEVGARAVIEAQAAVDAAVAAVVQ